MPTYTKRGKRILAQVRVRPFRPIAKTFDKREAAVAWAEALESNLKAQAGRGLTEDLASLTIERLIEAFLADPDTQALRYFASISALLAWWVNFAGHAKVIEVNARFLRKARDELRPGRQPATVNRHLSALRSCWNWGRAAGLIAPDHLWPTRLMLRENNERQRYLSNKELSRLLKSAAVHSPTMHAAIVVSVACGLRQGELLRLTWADIDLKAQRARILKTKTDRARSVYLAKAAVDALKGLKSNRVVGAVPVFLAEDGEPLNKGTLRVRWLAVRDAAKLRDFRWHDLRHSCASFLAQQGATLLEIGSVLGHSSPVITRRYAHLVEGAPVTGHAALDAMLNNA